MNQHDPLNIEGALEESEAQSPLQTDQTERKKKRFVEPTISEPIDVLKTTTIFQAPGESGCFGNDCPP